MTVKTFNLMSESGADKYAIVNRGDDATRNSANCSELYKAHPTRWIMLILFICFTFMNSVQWGEYIIISDMVQRYYNVSGGMVDNTTIVYMITYIPLIFPALWLLEKMGTRFCLLLSCTGLCVGACIKLVASFYRDMFYLVLLGQAIGAAFQVLAFGLAARIAAVWFAADQVSLACALAVLGDQLGTAIGFFLPAIVVSPETEESIGSGLVNLNLIIVSSTSLILIITSIFFLEAPQSPPSAAQALSDQQSGNVLELIKQVLRKKSFIAMMLAYGILNAGFNGYVALLNSFFLVYFPDKGEIHVGFISFLIMLSGIFGSLCFGWLFDKTHMFKGLTLLMYICATIMTIVNIFVPQYLILILFYASNMIMGFFMIGYYSVGIQLAIEISFPVPESIVSSLLLLPTQLIGIPQMKLYRWLFDVYGFTYANAFFGGALIVGCCLTAIIPGKFRRAEANIGASCPPLPEGL